MQLWLSLTAAASSGPEGQNMQETEHRMGAYKNGGALVSLSVCSLEPV